MAVYDYQSVKEAIFEVIGSSDYYNEDLETDQLYIDIELIVLKNKRISKENLQYVVMASRINNSLNEIKTIMKGLEVSGEIYSENNILKVKQQD